jgi:hypothetical protein
LTKKDLQISMRIEKEMKKMSIIELIKHNFLNISSRTSELKYFYTLEITKSRLFLEEKKKD